jgi:hypothetical protein
MLRVETGTERLVRATLEHRVVTFAYRGLRRTVEPHLIGIHEAGEALLVGYQTGGFSGSGDLPGWRTFVTSEIESVEPEGPTFEPVRPDFDAEAHRMVEIFARA